MDIARHVFIALFSGLVIAGMSWWAKRIPNRPDPEGWQKLKPSPMHWFGLVLGTLLFGFIGSMGLLAEPAGCCEISTCCESEANQTAYWILLGVFGLMVPAMGYSILAIHRRAVRWRGTEIAFNATGATSQQAFADIVDIKQNMLGNTVLCFADGGRVSLDVYALGYQDLAAAIVQDRFYRDASDILLVEVLEIEHRPEPLTIVGVHACLKQAGSDPDQAAFKVSHSYPIHGPIDGMRIGDILVMLVDQSHPGDDMRIKTFPISETVDLRIIAAIHSLDPQSGTVRVEYSNLGQTRPDHSRGEGEVAMTTA